MAKVRLTQSLVGTDFSAKAGEVIDLPEDEASRLVKGGAGALVADDESTPNNKKTKEK
jgi:hypothetical protein